MVHANAEFTAGLALTRNLDVFAVRSITRVFLAYSARFISR